MGHLIEKYTREYFLGAVDKVTGRPYGVAGHAEFKEHEVDGQHRAEFDFTVNVTGGVAGRDMLDIGFGRGDHIPLFLEQGVRSYLGIDFSAESLNIARERISDPRVRLEIRDATELRDDESFDVIVLYDVIEHIPAFEMEVVWRRLKRALRPGGFIVISTPLFETPNVSDHSDTVYSVMGVHCNKQTLGTVVRSALLNGFVIAGHEGRCFGLVRGDDLGVFGDERRRAFLSCHEGLLGTFGLRHGSSPSLRELRACAPGMGRVLIGCVAENNPKYLSQALRLLQSVRWFGGALSGANVMICIVDEADETYVKEFRRWGAFVRVVPRFSYFHAPSNKLRFLDLPELFAYDAVMLLDCDTLVVRDPSPYVRGETFQAKMADLATVPHDVFERLFSAYGLAMPERKHHCTFSDEQTVWYCNAGVLVFPGEVLTAFYPVWRRYTEDLSRRIDMLGSAGFHCEQASLTLAFHEHPVPFEELPVAMNFPLHLDASQAPAAMQSCDPVIIHYHHLTDPSGFVSDTPYGAAQGRITAFNERLRLHRREVFNNRFFWDHRYAEHADLGSGLGSRELPLLYKRQMLRQALSEFKPESILDVGCGDQEVAVELPDEAYLGVDLSPVVIERNRLRFPNRRFAAADFATLSLPKRDLTICFDVLIHADSPELYRKIVGRLVASTAHHGIVSGFEAPPEVKSDITFFHEPLSATLMSAGATKLRRLGEYRDTVVWCFSVDSGEGHGPAGAQEASDVRQGFLQTLSTRLFGASGSSSPSSAQPSEKGLREPVFLVGGMRSGTTLLAELLGRHREIVHCPFELKHVWSEGGGVVMASPRTRDTVCPQLGAEDASPERAERLTKAFLEEYRKNAANKEPGARFLNKNPHLCNKLFFVDSLFPDAKYIWIHRAMTDVAASLKRLFMYGLDRHKVRHYWPARQDGETRCWNCFHDDVLPDGIDVSRLFPGGDAAFLAEYWMESNLAVSRFREAAGHHRVLAVREEDLIEETGRVITLCEAFIGAALDVSMLEGYAIDGQRNDRWAEALTADEMRALLGFIEAYGPEPEGSFPEAGVLMSYAVRLKSALSGIGEKGGHV